MMTEDDKGRLRVEEMRRVMMEDEVVSQGPSARTIWRPELSSSRTTSLYHYSAAEPDLIPDAQHRDPLYDHNFLLLYCSVSPAAHSISVNFYP
jgi:hypothetical protein